MATSGRKLLDWRRVIDVILLAVSVTGLNVVFSSEVIGIALFISSAAVATLGATIVWQSFSGYDKALVDADGMMAKEREAMRLYLRRDRRRLGFALVVLIATAALASICGSMLKDGVTESALASSLLAFFGTTGAAIATVTTHAIWQLFSSLDDFRASIRDAVREERARAAMLAEFKADAPKLAEVRTSETFAWKVSGAKQ